ncbi:MAG TPA: VOC family protein [Chloroflexota bacterium]|nr:VOC family protein [Chloroflexota bacterium]
MILAIDHVGLAVRDVAGAAATFARLTARPAGTIETLAGQAVRVCFVPHEPEAGPEEARLELLEPLAQDTPVARFLSRRGEGLHHVCFLVDDIRREMERLAGEGFTLIDRAPRRGHGGLVAFLHPQSAHGVLVELLQRDRPYQPDQSEPPERQT